MRAREATHAETTIDLLETVRLLREARAMMESAHSDISTDDDYATIERQIHFNIIDAALLNHLFQPNFLVFETDELKTALNVVEGFMESKTRGMPAVLRATYFALNWILEEDQRERETYAYQVSQIIEEHINTKTMQPHREQKTYVTELDREIFLWLWRSIVHKLAHASHG